MVWRSLDGLALADQFGIGEDETRFGIRPFLFLVKLNRLPFTMSEDPCNHFDFDRPSQRLGARKRFCRFSASDYSRQCSCPHLLFLQLQRLFTRGRFALEAKRQGLEMGGIVDFGRTRRLG